eukprot:gnl/TRDRNA2_/TRDRNA2_148921_c0_seq1.p1 gnl/TRDRNA2_/TRDRNA2_148921_c0~~gnl/TRDRNA2_/TRDRNA2_148921_c0_seq1.p1  ORF type:complete len:115 (-),score=9.44 gnl/TRDRNA2_/TRDRNA2_148921_c0_seq1:220-564(-)
MLGVLAAVVPFKIAQMCRYVMAAWKVAGEVSTAAIGILCVVNLATSILGVLGALMRLETESLRSCIRAIWDIACKIAPTFLRVLSALVSVDVAWLCGYVRAARNAAREVTTAIL